MISWLFVLCMCITNIFLPPVDELKERALQRYNKVRVSSSLSQSSQFNSLHAHLYSLLLCSCRARRLSAWCLARMISLCSYGTLQRRRSLWPDWLATVLWSMKCSSLQTPDFSHLLHLINQSRSGMDALESKNTLQMSLISCIICNYASVQ